MPRLRAGFSLVEALISIALLFFIAMMILPLMSRSAQLNLSGRESTSTATHSRSTLEDYSRIGFFHPRLEVSAGTEAVTRELWLPVGETGVGRWVAEGTETNRDPLWQRQISVRQYGIVDLTGDPLDEQELDDPLPADTDPIQVHLKEVEVEVRSTRAAGSPVGGGSRIVMRTLKAF